MSEFLLPLFPLKVVLFPRMELPLHIFEERYKQMIGESMARRSEFGIVLSQEEGLARAGCAATVAGLIKKYDDGRLDIIVRGARRFEILQLNQELACLRGEPAFFEDEPGEEILGSDPRRAESLRLYEEVVQFMPSRDHDPAIKPPQQSDPQLSFQLIAPLPVDLGFRQALLEMRSESRRLDEVIAHLGKLKAFLSRQVQARAKAGSNGHGEQRSLRLGQ